MADSSTFVQSVENPQHNVDSCINSALAKAIEENRHNSSFRQNVFYFVDGKRLVLQEDGGPWYNGNQEVFFWH